MTDRDSQTNRETDHSLINGKTKTDRQTDRQTDRDTDKERQRREVGRETETTLKLDRLKRQK